MELSIISEETVKVLDRHVWPGAGKLAIRSLFVGVILFGVTEVWNFIPKLWNAAIALQQESTWRTVQSFWNSKALNALGGMGLLLFCIASGAYVTTMALNGLAWVWRHPSLASDQISLAWKESAPLKRVWFIVVMSLAALVMISFYVAAVLLMIFQAQKQL